MNSPEVLAEALSAAEGGAISTAVLYPLEVREWRGRGREGMGDESEMMRIGNLIRPVGSRHLSAVMSA